MDGIGLSEVFTVDVVEKSAQDKMTGKDVDLVEGFWEMFAVPRGQGELVLAKASEFFEVMIAGIGPGQGQADVGFHSEVEFRRQLEVDQCVVLLFPKKKIEFADGVVSIVPQR